MEPYVSLPSSQKLATGSYPEPDDPTHTSHLTDSMEQSPSWEAKSTLN
jgi:hypothetical protein